MDVVDAALLGLVSTVFMAFTEFPFWRRWGISGVAEWQVNWITLSVLGMIPRDSLNREPRASLRVIASHLVHGMAASIVFVLLLPSLLANLPLARVSIVLDALTYSLVLWVIFSVALKRVYERKEGIRIRWQGIFASLLSHFVYGTSLGLLMGIVTLAVP